uniref:RING-type E3 ubiquitin transferase n=2 Tax=Palpitomonas bilix TaxID=652834 RepID=A0A7S3LWA4_9EUKA
MRTQQQSSSGLVRWAANSPDAALVTALASGTMAGATAYFARRRMKDSEFIRDIPLVSLSEVPAIVAANPDESVLVKVKGEVRASQPLVAPLSGTQCVVVRTMKVRHYEEQRKTIVKGKKTSKKEGASSEVTNEKNSWKTGEEQYGVEELDTDFCIVDTSGGAARVSKDLLKDWIGARYFDLIKAKDEYQPVSNSSEQRSTKRTIGYSLKEYVLPLGVEIVVLAEAAIDPSAEGGIILRRPSKKNMFDRARMTNTYLVTRMSEDALLDDIERRGFLWLGSSAITGAISLTSLGALHFARDGSIMAAVAAAAGLLAAGTALFVYGQDRRKERRDMVKEQRDRASTIPSAPVVE